MERQGLTPGTLNAGQTATLLAWRPCRSGVEVLHWQLTRVGHLPQRLVGRHTTLISAAEEVWSFVSQYRLGGR